MAKVNLNMSSGSKWGELILDLTPGTQSISNNTTSVSYKLYLKRTATNFGGYWSNNASSAKLTINGSVISVSNFTYDFSSIGSTKTLKTGSISVGHNADGTKSLSFSASVNMAGNVPNGSLSGSLKLKTIARASSFSLGGATSTGGSISVSISRASSSFTHRVRWKVGSGSWISHSNSATTSASISVAHSRIPNATKATITVGVRTKLGSTWVGSEVTRTRSMSVPSSVVPSFSISHAETITAVSSIGASGYIQGHSRPKIEIKSASAGSGSSIKSYSIALTSNGSSSSSNWTVPALKGSGSKTITAKVTDNRGRTTTVTDTLDIHPYSPPQVESLTVNRSTSNGTIDPMGTYANIAYRVSASSLKSGDTEKNTLSLRIRTRPTGGNWSTKETYTGITQDTSRTYANYLQTQDYDVELYLTDKLSSTTLTGGTAYLPTAGVPFFVGAKGIATAVGKIPTHGSRYNLEIGPKGLKVDGPIIDKEGMELLAPVDFVIEQGSNYTKWNSGKLECWGTRSVNSSGNVQFDLGLPSNLHFIDIKGNGRGASASLSIQRPGGYDGLNVQGKGLTIDGKGLNATLWRESGSFPSDTGFSFYVIGRWK